MISKGEEHNACAIEEAEGGACVNNFLKLFRFNCVDIVMRVKGKLKDNNLSLITQLKYLTSRVKVSAIRAAILIVLAPPIDLGRARGIMTRTVTKRV